MQLLIRLNLISFKSVVFIYTLIFLNFSHLLSKHPLLHLPQRRLPCRYQMHTTQCSHSDGLDWPRETGPVMSLLILRSL